MIDPKLIAPDLTEYRWALYACGHLLDLTSQPHPPVGLYRDEQSANLYGLHMWPSTFTVVDLHKDDRS
ncbi:hypothetical protein H8F21_16885 [Pseudomonas sp. P66]|uniref:Uncharacterized protein n=1 Tax=Pseudomonas arcuscaelestis TaxID=2710591 RepID=A0ABS2C2G1_9PSED|nr:hypothetical protein [Pseudomonas arcuscaelestis]MBM5459244.1 hypothetical protein [Pseudomonas arcuscaelestis]